MSLEENPFEHILYEFTMYIMTSCYSSEDQFTIYLLVDSHLLHLRNVAYFFDCKKKCYLHASEFINDSSCVLIDSKKLQDIYRYTNNAACHMAKERLKSSYKHDTNKCKQNAYPLLKECIFKYVELLNSDIKPAYATFWNDPKIKIVAQSFISLNRTIG